MNACTAFTRTPCTWVMARSSIGLVSNPSGSSSQSRRPPSASLFAVSMFAAMSLVAIVITAVRWTVAVPTCLETIARTGPNHFPVTRRRGSTCTETAFTCRTWHGHTRQLPRGRMMRCGCGRHSTPHKQTALWVSPRLNCRILGWRPQCSTASMWCGVIGCLESL